MTWGRRFFHPLPDLILGVALVVASRVASRLEPSWRELWTWAPLPFGLGLLVSGLLLVVQGRAATAVARAIHFLMFAACLDLLPVFALFVISPFHWGALLVLGAPAALGVPYVRGARGL